MPVAALDRLRVGLDKTERLERQPQQIGGDLRKAGLVALAVRLRAEHQCHPAVRLEADLGAFAGGSARSFEKARDPNPAQPAALAPQPARRAAKPSVRSRCAISSRLAAKRPQSIVTPSPLLVREAADQVAPAQRDRVEREPARGAIDEPLDQVIGLGLAGAAIGVDRHACS